MPRDGRSERGVIVSAVLPFIEDVAQAAKRAGGTDAAKLRKQLHSSKFDTVLGTIGFDAKGDVTAPGYVFYEWKDGTYDYTTF